MPDSLVVIAQQAAAPEILSLKAVVDRSWETGNSTPVPLLELLRKNVISLVTQLYLFISSPKGPESGSYMGWKLIKDAFTSQPLHHRFSHAYERCKHTVAVRLKHIGRPACRDLK